MNFEKREDDGIGIFRRGLVIPINQSQFQVKSGPRKRAYLVQWAGQKWSCTCKDFEKTGKRCKHIYAVIHLVETRRVVTALRPEPTEVRCTECGSTRFKKRGFRYNKAGKLQTYQCMKCDARFVPEHDGGLKTEAVVAMAGLDLYFRGLSLRSVAEHLELIWKRKVSYASVLNWIRRFVAIAEKAVDRPLPRHPERWNGDETPVRLNGRHIQLWSLLDPDSRFLIAVQVTKRRGKKEANAIMMKGKKVAGTPREVVTDGLPSYAPAVEDLLARRKEAIHVQGPGLLKGQNNNRLERLNGSVKRRVKPMGAFRSMKGARTFAAGYRIYHNFVKPHRALGGRTPAEAAGLSDRRLGWDELTARKARRRARSR